ncbi:MAG: hypothetical protein H6756_09925 [Candidatus Omnitrophica bacterium]|nr:hypothetical protein [Candidatus Omnitrophota bacterium]MCB9721184.1 hypothetical protein [Candidatus Omnitrophota bacterium]
MRRLLIALGCALLLTGCETVKNVERQREYLEETEVAVGVIAEAVTGQALSEEEKKELQEQIRNDPEAQSAVQAIADSHTKPMRMKYSPATGKRYAGHLEVDPETGVKLLWLDEE